MLAMILASFSGMRELVPVLLLRYFSFLYPVFRNSVSGKENLFCFEFFIVCWCESLILSYMS